MYSKIKWSNFGENPYYLTLQLAANVSKKSRTHNFGDINLILCMQGDMDDRIKWSFFGENRITCGIFFLNHEIPYNLMLFGIIQKLKVLWEKISAFGGSCTL